MTEQENVYEDTTRGAEESGLTEESAEKGGLKEASAVPQKFKDVDALVRAYGSLQAEFTRRSQRLKELEREVENFKGQGENGATKLKMLADKRRAEGKKFDEFVSELEMPLTAKPQAEPETSLTYNGEESEEKTVGKGRAETKHSADAEAPWTEREEARTTPVANGFETAELTPEELYEKVNKSEEVRLRVIGEYLSSLGQKGAPLMRGGVGTFATPPKKAKSVLEAGDMALRFFKNGKTQA